MRFNLRMVFIVAFLAVLFSGSGVAAPMWNFSLPSQLNITQGTSENWDLMSYIDKSGSYTFQKLSSGNASFCSVSGLSLRCDATNIAPDNYSLSIEATKVSDGSTHTKTTTVKVVAPGVCPPCDKDHVLVTCTISEKCHSDTTYSYLCTKNDGDGYSWTGCDETNKCKSYYNETLGKRMWCTNWGGYWQWRSVPECEEQTNSDGTLKLTGGDMCLNTNTNSQYYNSPVCDNDGDCKCVSRDLNSSCERIATVFPIHCNTCGVGENSHTFDKIIFATGVNPKSNCPNGGSIYWAFQNETNANGIAPYGPKLNSECTGSGDGCNGDLSSRNLQGDSKGAPLKAVYVYYNDDDKSYYLFFIGGDKIYEKKLIQTKYSLTVKQLSSVSIKGNLTGTWARLLAFPLPTGGFVAFYSDNKKLCRYAPYEGEEYKCIDLTGIQAIDLTNFYGIQDYGDYVYNLNMFYYLTSSKLEARYVSDLGPFTDYSSYSVSGGKEMKLGAHNWKIFSYPIVYWSSSGGVRWTYIYYPNFKPRLIDFHIPKDIGVSNTMDGLGTVIAYVIRGGQMYFYYVDPDFVVHYKTLFPGKNYELLGKPGTTAILGRDIYWVDTTHNTIRKEANVISEKYGGNSTDENGEVHVNSTTCAAKKCSDYNNYEVADDLKDCSSNSYLLCVFNPCGIFGNHGCTWKGSQYSGSCLVEKAQCNGGKCSSYITEKDCEENDCHFNGGYGCTWNGEECVNANGNPNGPSLAFDYIISDTGNHRVLLVSKGGHTVWRYGCNTLLDNGECKAGDGESDLDSPHDAVYVEANDTVVIADSHNNRVLVVSPNTTRKDEEGVAYGGKVLWEITGLSNPYSAIPVFENVSGKPVWKGKILVTEHGSESGNDNGDVKEFDKNGNKIWTFSDVKHPSDAYPIYGTDLVLIADTSNSRIIELNYTSEEIEWTYGCKSSSVSLTSGDNVLISCSGSAEKVNIEDSQAYLSFGNLISSVIQTSDGNYLLALPDIYVVNVTNEYGTVSFTYGTSGMSGSEIGNLTAPFRARPTDNNWLLLTKKPTPPPDPCNCSKQYTCTPPSLQGTPHSFCSYCWAHEKSLPTFRCCDSPEGTCEKNGVCYIAGAQNDECELCTSAGNWILTNPNCPTKGNCTQAGQKCTDDGNPCTNDVCAVSAPASASKDIDYNVTAKADVSYFVYSNSKNVKNGVLPITAPKTESAYYVVNFSSSSGELSDDSYADILSSCAKGGGIEISRVSPGIYTGNISVCEGSTVTLEAHGAAGDEVNITIYYNGLEHNEKLSISDIDKFSSSESKTGKGKDLTFNFSSKVPQNAMNIMVSNYSIVDPKVTPSYVGSSDFDDNPNVDTSLSKVYLSGSVLHATLYAYSGLYCSHEVLPDGTGCELAGLGRGKCQNGFCKLSAVDYLLGSNTTTLSKTFNIKSGNCIGNVYCANLVMMQDGRSGRDGFEAYSTTRCLGQGCTAGNMYFKYNLFLNPSKFSQASIDVYTDRPDCLKLIGADEDGHVRKTISNDSYSKTIIIEGTPVGVCDKVGIFLDFSYGGERTYETADNFKIIQGAGAGCRNYVKIDQYTGEFLVRPSSKIITLNLEGGTEASNCTALLGCPTSWHRKFLGNADVTKCLSFNPSSSTDNLVFDASKGCDVTSGETETATLKVECLGRQQDLTINIYNTTSS